MADKTSPSPWFSDSVYNLLKFTAQILLPGLGTLYAGVGAIWGLPDGDQVVGTIIAVDTFLGLLLGISSAQYSATDRYDGAIVVSQANGKTTHELVLHDDPAEIQSKKHVDFKVVHQELVSPTPGDLPEVPPLPASRMAD